MQHLSKILLAGAFSLVGLQQAFAWGDMGPKTATPPSPPPSTMTATPASTVARPPVLPIPPSTIIVPQPPPMSTPGSQPTTWSSPNPDGTTSYYQYDPKDGSVVRTGADGSAAQNPGFVQQVTTSLAPSPAGAVAQPPVTSAPASKPTTWSDRNADGTISYYKYDPGDGSVVRTQADGTAIPNPGFVQQVSTSVQSLFSSPPDPRSGSPELGAIIARPTEKSDRP